MGYKKKSERASNKTRAMVVSTPERKEPPDEPNVDVLPGRRNPLATSFDQLRPRLLELANETIEDVRIMAEKARSVETEKESSRIYYLDRSITRQVDLMKLLAGMVPLGFYQATDPMEHVIDPETERLKAFAEIHERAIELSQGDIEIS